MENITHRERTWMKKLRIKKTIIIQSALIATFEYVKFLGKFGFLMASAGPHRLALLYCVLSHES